MSTLTPAAKFLRRARFLRSVPSIDVLPPDQGREVAFLGRSNAGKSTAINALVDQRGLARTSKTPGRTRELVLFEIEPGRRLVDLPGYGHAAVGRAQRAHWPELIWTYLEQRRSLCGLVLLMDVRRPLTELDRALLELLDRRALPLLVLLSKADQIARSAALAAVASVRETLADAPGSVRVEAFSAQARWGIESARAEVHAWLSGA
jgi:GTP-binding protein